MCVIRLDVFTFNHKRRYQNLFTALVNLKKREKNPILYYLLITTFCSYCFIYFNKLYQVFIFYTFHCLYTFYNYANLVSLFATTCYEFAHESYLFVS